MTGGVLFAKNCGHCAKDVGFGVSSAALSNCGDRAQEELGTAEPARDNASTAAKRTRLGQENKRITEQVEQVGQKRARLEHHLSLVREPGAHTQQLLQLLAATLPIQNTLQMGVRLAWPARKCFSTTSPTAVAPAPREVPPPRDVPQLNQSGNDLHGAESARREPRNRAAGADGEVAVQDRRHSKAGVGGCCPSSAGR